MVENSDNAFGVTIEPFNFVRIMHLYTQLLSIQVQIGWSKKIIKNKKSLAV